MNEINIRVADEFVNVKYNFKDTYESLRSFICKKECKDSVTIDLMRLQDERDFLLKQFPNSKFSYADVEYNAVYRDLVRYLLNKDIHIIHGVLLNYLGEGILFMAPSGTGKSTHARLWKDKFSDNVKIINGDKPLLKFHGENIIAYGSPWMGKEKIGTCESVILKKICIIKRAKKNSLHKIEWDANAISFLLVESLLPNSEDYISRQIKWLKKLTNTTDLYELHCNISEDAVNVAYEGLFAMQLR